MKACRRQTTVNYKPKWSFNLQPKKQLFAKLKQLKAELSNSKLGEQKAVQAKKSVR